MKRVLMLAPVPVSAAATRFRLQQFVPALRQAGVEVSIRPFLTTHELRTLYAPDSIVAMAKTAVAALHRRLNDLVTASRADLVLVQREAALVGPPLLEWAIAYGLKRPLVFDFDDAIWEPYTSPTYGRWLPRLVKMPRKTHFTLKAATEVIAGNHYLAAYARRYNKRVTVLPTVVDTNYFTPSRARSVVPILGWIGTHSTTPYLLKLIPALVRLARTHKFVLRLVGADIADAANISVGGVAVDLRPWALEQEVSEFQGLDVGLYPMDDDAWSRGKSGFKAIQYMACGVPVVASPVGSVNEIICSGANGFFAKTEDEWVQTLAHLLDDAGLRTRVGDAGRTSVQEQWSLQKFSPVFVDVIARALA